VNGSDVKFDLPEKIADKVSAFGETSYGATVVTLVLKDGTRVPGVAIAWGRHVIKAKHPEHEVRLCGLGPSDIVDALPEP
jgi:hypothetical protein